jgi:hypothetical protein
VLVMLRVSRYACMQGRRMAINSHLLYRRRRRGVPSS